MRVTFATIRPTDYPPQYWLVASGVLISSIGSSMIWPFQLIYISNILNQPLSRIATLITISSLTGMLVSFAGGSIADKIGRRPIMIGALLAHGLGFILMSLADSYIAFLIPMTLMGAAMPFYAIGSDAMMADMIAPKKRVDAYAILRMTNNAGIAIGPAIGGMVISALSYTYAFYGAALGMFIFSLLLILFSSETLTRTASVATSTPVKERLGGYDRVFQDRGFVAFVGAVTLGMIAPLLMWTLLAVYTNRYYGLPEDLYRWLPITNALMCVFVQYPVTYITRRFPAGIITTLGMLVYALGVGSVALMTNFNGFLASMVIITFGELILIPTASKYVADMAPEDLRGRYMSLYWLTWGLARALAPIIGGFLHDQISPQAIWWGGLGFGLVSTVILLGLALRRQPTPN
ncbi:MAG: MFS transporter [Anaerolineales bacterium]